MINKPSNAEAIVITNVTAIPIPKEASTFLDTPINGQHPKNLAKITLFINIEPIIILNKLPKLTIIPPYSFSFQDS